VLLEPLLGQFGPMVRQVTKLEQDFGWRIVNSAQRQGFQGRYCTLNVSHDHLRPFAVE